MTKVEAENKLKQILKSIQSKDKKFFLNQLKQINKKIDKLDKFMKNVLDGIKLTFTFSIDKKVFKEILKQIRGNAHVTSEEPEGTYDVLNKYGYDLVERAREQKNRSCDWT